ncbi:hypothetical protein K1T71_012996 [Dendrolimus kikuchii]|uniref:Uncharacterized protein n=1 Tax=Dendrolimus kikuchii TaxID=765133 RepID=A0ACC1CIR9_9NEOP|nr:hypothetical protein K1T71_012996 [Dendrolimus kikuchii]
MATKLESDLPSSPANDESDPAGSDYEEQEPNDKPSNNNVSDILKRLQSTGALLKKPKEEYHCFTCNKDYSTWSELEKHLITHVSLPSVLVDKLPSDDEDTAPGEDENWSDEEDVAPPETTTHKTPQKIDISQLLKKTGISLKSSTASEPKNSPNTALDKLSGLGFTIKKNAVSVKKEKDPEQENGNDILKKLGNLGGLKLKLKSSGNSSNCFKVVNGLRDFKASDDEEDGSGNEGIKEDNDDDFDDEEQHKPDISGAENESGDDNDQDKNEGRKTSGSEDSDTSPKKINVNLSNVLRNITEVKKELPTKSPLKMTILPLKQQPAGNTAQPKPVGRPAVKQTPKRVLNSPAAYKEVSETKHIPTPVKIAAVATPERRQSNQSNVTPNSTPERRQASIDSTHSENIVVKQEVDTSHHQQNAVPLFSQQIKSERTSPPLNAQDNSSTPILATVKADPDGPNVSQGQPIYSFNHSNTVANRSEAATPLLPIAKKEPEPVTAIIEINGDSNDEDDDCCVVSTTPASDVKPVIPKIEKPVSYPSTTYTTSQPNFTCASTYPSTLASRLTSAPSMEKQHNFNWNAPDSKPSINALDKSADEIFESLLSNSTKKENMSLLDASEYISLDTLGPQHSCEVCNTRFTDISLLEEHRRMTGHSMSLVTPSSSSAMIPYGSGSSILSSLLPVKQLADQVGKLSGINSGSGFTHQQNVMINIQAYPGGGGVMVPPQSYNSYPPGQNMPPGYSPSNNTMFSAPGQTIPGQYPGQSYMGPQQSYVQFPTQMPKTGYPTTSPQNPYSSENSPYSTASPLQSMQQAVYGQSATSTQMGTGTMGPPAQVTMGPPGAPLSNPYVPSSSPSGTIRPQSNSGIRIQTVQTFPPGQFGTTGQMSDGQSQSSVAGQIVGGQMPSPSQIRMAPGANIVGPRPRMAGVRCQKPTLRPGIQVHGQIRGAKPGVRMPAKRPAGAPPGQMLKKRPNMLLPDKHDNEDCQVMAMQKQREGLPMIQSVQGARDKLNLGSQISITKKTVNKEANAMANVLASRGISVKQKQKSRSPTPERPLPHIPNLGAGVSIKHTSKSSSFSIPEAKVGGGMLSCKICKKMFMNQNSLQVHMSTAHPQSKVPLFKCDECPASYPKSLQLQHHKRVFHNVSGPNRELGLPVVDLSQEDNLKRLSGLGIYSFIPLANREQAGGCFGIPVISVHSMQNGMTNSLQALGADGLLSLGPLKPLPNS